MTTQVQTPAAAPDTGAQAGAASVSAPAGAPSPNPSSSRRNRRHRSLIASFVCIVILPCTLAAAYLFAVAADQYASTTGFVVRQSDKSSASALDLLGGISSLTSASSVDTTILYEFIRSQRMVELVQKEIDLRSIYSRPDFDPVFAFDPDGTIEDLTRHWSRMVKLHYDSGSGLLELRALAFTPQDAHRIAEEILRQSSLKVNELSAIARSDATRYAQEDLTKAVETLKQARRAITEFRNRTQIVDPSADIQGQMGLISNLQTQLAEALIELDLLLSSTRKDDPRVAQYEQRIAVIEHRIKAEREKIGVDSSGEGNAFSDIVGEYEELSVDLEFAQQSYLAAKASYDLSLAEANRQNRYIATYVDPTVAQQAEYPRRFLLVALIALFSLMIWAIGSLVSYTIHDRR